MLKKEMARFSPTSLAIIWRESKSITAVSYVTFQAIRITTRSGQRLTRR